MTRDQEKQKERNKVIGKQEAFNFLKDKSFNLLFSIRVI